jgi:uncharacterized delta-60 repeat protein
MRIYSSQTNNACGARPAKHIFLWIMCVFFGIGLNAYAQNDQQKARLRAMAAQSRATFRAENDAAKVLAARLGLPIRIVTPDGRIIELQRFRNGLPRYYTTLNLNAARTISTDDLWPGGTAGRSLTGAGQILGIWDGGGVRDTHQEFVANAISRVTQVDVPSGDSDHATHVAGTMIAAGDVANARGMASEANLRAFDWNGDVDEMADEAANGLRVSNHSYGFLTGWHLDQQSGVWFWYGDPAISQTVDYLFGFYNAEARAWDEIARNAPNYLIVKSAGNDRNQGPANQPINHLVFDPAQGWVWSQTVRNLDGAPNGFDCIEGSALSKNVLSVGAVNDLPNGYTGAGGVVMSVFSSWGPTDDGRIKPDVVANGVDLTSAVSSSDTAYGVASGTSMSSPSVAGSIGLLQQHYANVFTGDPPWSSTIKALLIQTADEAGANNGPDYSFGWGLVNTRRATEIIDLDARSGGNFNIRELVLGQGQTIQFQVVSDGTQPLRATIAWTDPAGVPPADGMNPPNLMLVNDLDLRLIGPSITHQPWVLAPATPGNAAQPGDNTRDNVEQVHIAAPAAGTYTVRITHKGNLTEGPQNVSVIVSGNFTGGTIDQTFTPGLGANNTVNAVAVQPDGRIVIGGAFTQVNGSGRNYLARLNADGTVDGSSYWHYLSLDGVVNAIALQPDGKILIGGAFQNVFSYPSWYSRPYLVRLNANGSLDTTFNYVYLNGQVRAIKRQANGYILAGGDFSNNAPYSPNNIARYAADGSGDPAFNSIAGANGSVYAIDVDSTGRILMGGAFTQVNGSSRSYLARLNSNGTVDSSSYWFYLALNGAVNSVAVQSDDKVVIGGAFHDVFSYPSWNYKPYLTRLNVDGSLDTGFSLVYLNGQVRSLALQPNGYILAGGDFINNKPYSPNGIARFTSTGGHEMLFNAIVGTDDSVRSVALQADGRIMIGGSFLNVNGVSRPRIARLQ